jgi:undecaprenyl-diphosphatase
MITVWDACVLGLVQGLTEFLPVSSSGHLALLHQLIAPLPAAQTAAVDVALHAGTLAATVAYFRHDLLGMLGALAAPRTSGWQGRWIWLLLLGTLPAAVVGGLWRTQIEQAFVSMGVVGVGFVPAVVAGRAAAGGRDETQVGARDALLIGCFQALALVPGISRSGSTITGGMLSRLRPDVAARFSFLLGIPAVVGAELVEVPAVLALDRGSLLAVAAGIVVAAGSGALAIWTLLRLLAPGGCTASSFYLRRSGAGACRRVGSSGWRRRVCGGPFADRGRRRSWAGCAFRRSRWCRPPTCRTTISVGASAMPSPTWRCTRSAWRPISSRSISRSSWRPSSGRGPRTSAPCASAAPCCWWAPWRRWPGSSRAAPPLAAAAAAGSAAFSAPRCAI